MPTLGTNVAVLAEGRVLLIERRDLRVWSLPGGTIEPGESVAACAVREAREETGLDVELTRLVGVYSLPHWPGEGNHVVLFTARAVGGMLMEGADGEALAARYYAPDELPETTAWWHRQRVADAVAGGAAGAWMQDVAPVVEGALSAREVYELAERGAPPPGFVAALVRRPGAERERREV